MALLQVSPACLTFSFDSKHQVCCNLTLLNLHDAKPLTFKIKTTNPEQYFVCPRVGVLSPAQQLILRIFRLPQPEFAPIMDRFLIEVETLPGYDDGQHSPDLSGSQRQQLSLKAALRAPDEKLLVKQMRTLSSSHCEDTHQVLQHFATLLMRRGLMTPSQKELASIIAYDTMNDLASSSNHRHRKSKEYNGLENGHADSMKPLRQHSTADLALATSTDDFTSAAPPVPGPQVIAEEPAARPDDEVVSRDHSKRRNDGQSHELPAVLTVSHSSRSSSLSSVDQTAAVLVAAAKDPSAAALIRGGQPGEQAPAESRDAGLAGHREAAAREIEHLLGMDDPSRLSCDAAQKRISEETVTALGTTDALDLMGTGENVLAMASLAGTADVDDSLNARAGSSMPPASLVDSLGDASPLMSTMGASALEFQSGASATGAATPGSAPEEEPDLQDMAGVVILGGRPSALDLPQQQQQQLTHFAISPQFSAINEEDGPNEGSTTPSTQEAEDPSGHQAHVIEGPPVPLTVAADQLQQSVQHQQAYAAPPMARHDHLQGPEPSTGKGLTQRRSWAANLVAALRWPRRGGSRASSSQKSIEHSATLARSPSHAIISAFRKNNAGGRAHSLQNKANSMNGDVHAVNGNEPVTPPSRVLQGRNNGDADKGSPVPPRTPMQSARRTNGLAMPQRPASMPFMGSMLAGSAPHRMKSQDTSQPHIRAAPISAQEQEPAELNVEAPSAYRRRLNPLLEEARSQGAQQRRRGARSPGPSSGATTRSAVNSIGSSTLSGRLSQSPPLSLPLSEATRPANHRPSTPPHSGADSMGGGSMDDSPHFAKALKQRQAIEQALMLQQAPHTLLFGAATELEEDSQTKS
ncbi:hypothetical protein WJX73_004351 [Symbiochloris irregularis]|uniref:MSP domain-containing protein n=1 Tax=Symbiochloris irregularis TaxID=706552 RepID=A0AAW1NYQ6_9CHLO